MVSSFIFFASRQGLIVVITLLIYKLVSSRMSVAAFGEFNYILTAAEVVLLLVGFGAPEVVRRLAAQKSALHLIGGYFRIYACNLAIGSLLFSLCLCLLVSGSWAGGNELLFFTVLALFSFFSGIKRFYVSIYESLERYLILLVVLSLEAVSVLVLIFVLPQRSLTLSAVLLAYLIPLAVFSVLLFGLAPLDPSRVPLKQFFHDGVRFFSLGITIFLFHKIDIFLLEGLSSGEQLGLYTGMYRIYEASYVFPNIVTLLIYPRLFEKDTSSHKFFIRGLLINIFSGVLLIAVALAFSPIFINTILSSKFAEGKYVLHVLTMGMLLQAVSMVLGRGIIALNDEGLLLRIAAIGLVLNVGMNIVLIPAYGAIGAAFATVVSFTYSMLAQLYYYVYNKTQALLKIGRPLFVSIASFSVIVLAGIFKLYLRT